MGFYTTILEQSKPHPETPNSSPKSASRDFFSYPVKTSYQNRYNLLLANQEESKTTHKTASGRSIWLGRDPIQERGGLNIYGFVQNNGVNWLDVLGLATILPVESMIGSCPSGTCCENNKCVKDKCAKGSLLVELGRVKIRLHYLRALQTSAFGEPKGGFAGGNFRRQDSCKNQSSLLNSSLPNFDCWTCKVVIKENRLGADHAWVECKAENCNGEIVDELGLDYWNAEVGDCLVENRADYPLNPGEGGFDVPPSMFLPITGPKY